MKTNFERGQLNAQDDLNENFIEIENNFKKNDQTNIATITLATSNTTDFTPESKVIFQRWGQMVVANLYIENKLANFAGWKNLVQFPEGFHPSSMNSWGGALANKTNRNPALTVYANASGIQVMAPTNTLPAEQECCGTIIYFTNDPFPENKTN